jgi:hypothetical protein
MINNIFKTVALCLSVLAGTTVNAQEASTAAGGDASGSGGSVAFSIGQVAYTTNTGTNGSVAQGVQQPYEISTVTGIEGSNEILLNAVVYPNPTTDYIALQITGFEQGSFSYRLCDALGKVIEAKNVSTSETRINLKELASATYFLKVSNSKQEVKSFKIIKTF